jgi:hypothetical protein
MTRQAAESAAALWSRLQPRFDDDPRQQVEAGQAHWPNGFGADIADVHTVVVHCTAGWPSHSKWDEFVGRYTDPTTPQNERGVGPHYYLPYDGTVFRLLSENMICWHANHVNNRAIGVETGNLTNVAAPTGAGGVWPNHWTALSMSTEDLPGSRFYARFVNGEILIARYTTATAVVQADANLAASRMMQFSEQQYRAWALLARWLAEVWCIPRNFPLRPHIMRPAMAHNSQWRNYREIVDADPVRDKYINEQLQPAPVNCTIATYESDVAATGLPHVYQQEIHTQPALPPSPAHPLGVAAKTTSRLWTRLFDTYRGFHGHGYSGSNLQGHDDHNCPGALFDWHRFARSVWDYWWYPFDLAQATPASPITSGEALRDDGRIDGKLREHYFDVHASMYFKVTASGFFPVGDEAVNMPSGFISEGDETVYMDFIPTPMHTGSIGNLIRMYRRHWGFWHGGMHFELAAASPIYAMAAGQIVAARLGPVNSEFNRDEADSVYPSALFVLLRHEVFFQRGDDDRINYDAEPARVYSLYMHLGLPEALSYDNVVTANPGWLNRLIEWKKEIDLGQAFASVHPTPAAQWRPHTARWQRQQPLVDQLLTQLRAGEIARFPEGDDAVQVGLGDFLGISGHLDVNITGVHLEVLSADLIDDPWFETVDMGAAAARPYHDEQTLDEITSFINDHIPANGTNTGVELFRDLPAELKASIFQTVAVRSKSEWALHDSDFPGGGWAVAEDLMWWDDVVPDMNAALPDAADHLPTDGVVWNYHPIGFMAWLNDITWRSEWPKYRITDAQGTVAPAPDRPPPRV